MAQPVIWCLAGRLQGHRPSSGHCYIALVCLTVVSFDEQNAHNRATASDLRLRVRKKQIRQHRGVPATQLTTRRPATRKVSSKGFIEELVACGDDEIQLAQCWRFEGEWGPERAHLGSTTASFGTPSKPEPP
ncbi:hypothetical protein B0I72DRAFT_173181 [Yarrowia lipolytica]|uniref:Uncharacterized protein n=1 Tax=Yarrowia lipolytica TaxID=4952 RepID=A0A371C511_YARLL|nr:hypothetical protein B0I71DRAFT_165355 [Yarrowia lipolytica]RDW33944.1 hypothetical protein B0I72DRAFT_173181 [Yarrowia lipolytica]RDW41558.1 hypothetical protein B0I73DRAFT_167289 [Yarrowia lipolytica]RDW43871.1 hypothetical protein B0I74DRAFT_175846 [Yarrowia lipolytica]RDW50569.1 hypothetical protein B0I75DRAFT_160266 [Yarrowia lipolytica]